MSMMFVGSLANKFDWLEPLGPSGESAMIWAQFDKLHSSIVIPCLSNRLLQPLNSHRPAALYQSRALTLSGILVLLILYIYARYMPI